MKTCPYCSEQIQDTAKKCRYCGEFLSETFSDNSEKTTTKIHSQKHIKNSGKKTFYWTLGIGIAISLGGIASVQKGGDITGLFAGPGIVLASLGYLAIQKRQEGKRIYILLEVLVGIILGFFAVLSSPKELFENPIILLGQALFLSYYLYPIINSKILNKWGCGALKVLSVGVILFIVSMGILAGKNGPIKYSNTLTNEEIREMDKALEDSGIDINNLKR